MKSSFTRFILACLVVGVLLQWSTVAANAQCSTCETPVVAYQPVVAQTTVAYKPYTGWYPGKLIDNMRLRRYDRRYGVTTVAAPTYTTSYAPYTASYVPYTASYAPTTYTAAYRPYVTSYAPLVRTVARPVVQTSYYVPASPCNTCVQTVARQVVLSPVVSSACSVCQPGCTGCSVCSSCSTCSGGVSQAAYTEPGCSSCASGSATIEYTNPTPAAGGNQVGPNTGQPQLGPNEPIPSTSNYGAKKTPDPAPAKEQEAETDPYGLDGDKAEDAPGDSNTSWDPPRLLDPRDRTARRSSSSRVSVGVHNAVYTQNLTNNAVKRTSYKSVSNPIDADGWSSVPQ